MHSRKIRSMTRSLRHRRDSFHSIARTHLPEPSRSMSIRGTKRLVSWIDDNMLLARRRRRGGGEEEMLLKPRRRDSPTYSPNAHSATYLHDIRLQLTTIITGSNLPTKSKGTRTGNGRSVESERPFTVFRTGHGYRELRTNTAYSRSQSTASDLPYSCRSW